jgi:hypothetical protein
MVSNEIIKQKIAFNVECSLKGIAVHRIGPQCSHQKMIFFWIANFSVIFWSSSVTLQMNESFRRADIGKGHCIQRRGRCLLGF